MKKSEMIKIMAFTYGNLHRGGWSEATEEERMEQVLNVMEDCGMLPPVAKHCPVLLTTNFVWEPEQE